MLHVVLRITNLRFQSFLRKTLLFSCILGRTTLATCNCTLNQFVSNRRGTTQCTAQWCFRKVPSLYQMVRQGYHISMRYKSSVPWLGVGSYAPADPSTHAPDGVSSNAYVAANGPIAPPYTTGFIFRCWMGGSAPHGLCP